MQLFINRLAFALAILCLVSASAGLAQKQKKAVSKRVTFIYAKGQNADAPTLYCRFQNALSKDSTYTVKGLNQVLQVEWERRDGSIISLRNLTESMKIHFNIVLKDQATDLIIAQIGISGGDWFVQINNGKPVRLTNGVANLKLR